MTSVTMTSDELATPLRDTVNGVRAATAAAYRAAAAGMRAKAEAAGSEVGVAYADGYRDAIIDMSGAGPERP